VSDDASTEDGPFSPSNPAHVSKREKLARRAQARADADMRVLLNMPEGRRTIWRLLERGRMFATTFSTDSATAAFNEGGRNAALALVADVLRADPAAYGAMMLEAQAQQEADNG
jgi:hypothetical protein